MRQLHSLLRLLIAAVLFIGRVMPCMDKCQLRNESSAVRGFSVWTDSSKVLVQRRCSVRCVISWTNCSEMVWMLSSFRCVQSVMRSIPVSMSHGVSSLQASGYTSSPYWDPLQWMITECHDRGMELHAWINPYRAKTKNTTQLATNHVAVTNPNRVFSYDGLYILNPALPENRNYICAVVDDIVSRYDIDGLHIDDYFYPYPAAGQTIPDQASSSVTDVVSPISTIGDVIM